MEVIFFKFPPPPFRNTHMHYYIPKQNLYSHAMSWLQELEHSKEIYHKICIGTKNWITSVLESPAFLLAVRMLFHRLQLLHVDLQRFGSYLQVSELLKRKVCYSCCTQNAVMSSFEVCSTVGQRADETYPISRVLL